MTEKVIEIRYDDMTEHYVITGPLGTNEQLIGSVLTIGIKAAYQHTQLTLFKLISTIVRGWITLKKRRYEKEFFNWDRSNRFNTFYMMTLVNVLYMTISITTNYSQNAMDAMFLAGTIMPSIWLLINELWDYGNDIRG